MITIEKLASGHFRARIDLGVGPDGKRMRKSVTRRTEAECKVAAAGFVAASVTTKKGISYDAIPFSIAAREWLAGKTSIRERTKRGYHITIENILIPKFGDIRLGQISERDIRLWLTELQTRVTSTSARQYFIPLKSILGDFLKSRSPAVDIPLPRQIHFKAIPPSPDMMAHVLSLVAGTADEMYTVLMSCCGLRLGEVCGVTLRSMLL